MQVTNVPGMLHYQDDHITNNPANIPHCQLKIDTKVCVCEDFSVAIKHDKVTTLAPLTSFLGMDIDSPPVGPYWPRPLLAHYHEVSCILQSNFITKNGQQLHFMCSVCYPRCAFHRWMINTSKQPCTITIRSNSMQSSTMMQPGILPTSKHGIGWAFSRSQWLAFPYWVPHRCQWPQVQLLLPGLLVSMLCKCKFV